MNIESTNNFNSGFKELVNNYYKVGSEINKQMNLSKLIPEEFAPSPSALGQTTQTMDEATGLLQTIVKENFTEEIIRKMPTDDYLKLLSLMDDMINGSVNQQI